MRHGVGSDRGDGLRLRCAGLDVGYPRGMSNPTHTLTSEVTSARGGSLAETPSETYDAILQEAVERFDAMPVNDTAVRHLTQLAERLGYELNADALRAGSLLDGAILFAELVELVDDLDQQQQPKAPAA